MARIGEKSGELDRDEMRAIRNLFQFGSLTITDIMTPRTVIAALPAETPMHEALQFVTENPFSRVPVYEELAQKERRNFFSLFAIS